MVTYKKRSSFLKNWFERNILVAASYQHLMNHSEFISHFNFPVSLNEFNMVMNTVPSGALDKNVSFHDDISLLHPTETCCGKICFVSLQNTNRAKRALFLQDNTSVPYVTTYWNNFVSDITWQKVWLLPNKHFITNKIKEASFKLIHKYHPAKHFLKKFKSVSCAFCSTHPETVPHLFCHCVNLILILTKFHIHKCKLFHKRPLFSVFHKECELYLQSSVEVWQFNDGV